MYATWDAPDARTPVEYRIAWTPDGENFKRHTNTDWNAFPTGTGYTITGLEPGETYQVKVRARFTSRRSRWSEVVTGEGAATAPQPTPEPTPTTPGAPGNIGATPNGQTRIDLSWHTPSDDGGAEVTGYQIQVSVDGTAWSNLAANTGSTDTRYSQTGLEAEHPALPDRCHQHRHHGTGAIIGSRRQGCPGRTLQRHGRRKLAEQHQLAERRSHRRSAWRNRQLQRPRHQVGPPTVTVQS